FRSRHFHTAAWDHTCDLAGKKVAVIGTGASAIQVIPEMAPQVKHLTIFQRTPAWVTPRRDKAINEQKRKKLYSFPALIKLQREFIYWRNELIGFGFTGNNVINRIMRMVALHGLTRQVKDPETRRRLTPQYKIGCKRILRSDDYYKTFNQPNVSLVTKPIERFTETGIIADGNLHTFDAVIFATGFVAADIDLYVQIKGLDGQNLVDRWKENTPEAYLGTTVAGYPNFCLILGPNTGLGNNSVLHMMESQMNYIMGYIQALERVSEGRYFDLKQEVQDRYNHRLQQQFAGTVWSSGCRSWYMNRAGKNTTLFPRLSVTFRRLTKKFDSSVYRLCSAETKKPEAAISF
ncbi:MAG TPA: NAD(P)/FAD-dependent oxidoreductase, partial [Flavisolibacter sp.]|nr:NAD(P)/FAD-dependent oxidoreductase [Flavisolibacter sp.]